MSELKFQCLKGELHGATKIFSDTYADSTPSESHLRELCDSIAKELDKNEIKFAAFDGGFFMEIFVEACYLPEVKLIAKKSSIFAWSSYLDKK